MNGKYKIEQKLEYNGKMYWIVWIMEENSSVWEEWRTFYEEYGDNEETAYGTAEAYGYEWAGKY